MKVYRPSTSPGLRHRSTTGRWGEQTRRIGTVAVLVLLLAGMLPTWQFSGTSSAQALPVTQRATERVIIEVARGAVPERVARALGLVPTHVYNEVFQGFAAELPAEAIRAINRQQGVLRIWPDLPVQKAQGQGQTVPTGVDRVEADEYPLGPILTAGGGVDVDVAVLDTGIAQHPDLTIAGGKNCIDPNSNSYNDGDGHGTHVAGTIAAIDNDQGVVGVAPGARLWAVKVLDDSGAGSISSVICGLEWVSDNSGTIDVVNMSLSTKASRKDQKPCTGNTTPLHQAVCQVVNVDNIPVVVAAGNNGRNASKRAPATYEEVITVSAFADSDGEPGKKGPSTACGGRDDTFANFSNYGRDIDVAAPGVCIRSTWKGGTYARLSGTSMAAPHVTGAVALYMAQQGPTATAAGAREWIGDGVLNGPASRPNSSPYGFTGDPDKYDEGVLYLGTDQQ